MHSTSVISVSPSFTAHSSNNFADIAARVVQEFRNENDHDDIYDDLIDDDNQFYVPAGDQKLKENEVDEDEDEDEDGEFEFAVVRTISHSSPVSADEIFSNGEILPRYPLFDRSLLLDDEVSNFDKVSDNSDANSKPSPALFDRSLLLDEDVSNFDKVVSDNSDLANSKRSPVVRVPLRKLFIEERETASCSSSEADDLDGITPGTYCIWKPKSESPERSKKSNSTGNTSKRWKFVRNLLHRSNSDNSFSARKDANSVVVLNPVTETKKRSEKVKKVEKTSKVAVADGDDDGEITTTTTTPVTIENNPANKMNKGDNRIRTYIPYKQDLVGVFANVNGLSRNLHPF